MAQSLWDALTGMASMDNQTALAVQSLLESQNITENAAAPVDEDDLFQCGKCKRTFNSLQLFVAHKQVRCTGGNGQRPQQQQQQQQQQQLGNSSNSAFTSTVQQLPTYNTVTASPLTQTIGGQGMVLTDDLMTLTNIDQTIQTSTLQVGTSMQGNPFLTQLAPLTPRSAAATTTTTTFTTMTTPTLSSSQSAFTTIQTNQIQMQATAPPSSNQQHQQVIISGSVPAAPMEQKTSVMNPGNTSPEKIGVSMPESDGSMTDLNKRRGKGVVSADEGSTKKKMKCQYCDKAFSKNFDLQQHIRSHTGEKPFQCIVCGRAFAQKSNVKKHMQTHKVWPAGTANTLPSQPPPRMIVVENQEEPPPPPLQEEEETEITPEGILITDEVGSSKKGVRIVVDNSYLCQYCPMKFKSYFHLKTHMVQHKEEQVYKCIMKSCSQTFKELDDFLEHMKTHEKDMTYRCHMCNKQFPSLYELGVHQYSHSLYPNQGPRPGPRYYRCTKCLNKYATPEALEHHMQTTNHSYPCPHCVKVFPCERYLRRHLPIHGDATDHKCDSCGKMFKTEHSLKMHQLIHSGEKPYKCERCGAAFNRKDKLKRHMLVHDPIRKYKCPFRNHTGCMKEFNRPDKLKAHIISHSGIKPFRCKHCGRSFGRKSQLLDHEPIHTNTFKYSCDKCHRGFNKEKTFKEHRCSSLHGEGSEVTKIIKGASTLIRAGNRRKVGRPKKRTNMESPEFTREQKTLAAIRQRSRRKRVQQQEALKHQDKDDISLTHPGQPINEEVNVLSMASEHVSDSLMTDQMTMPGHVTNQVTQAAGLGHEGELPIQTVVLNAADQQPAFATVTITDMSGQSHEATVALADYAPQGSVVNMADYANPEVSNANDGTAALFSSNLACNISGSNLSALPNAAIIAAVSSNGTLVVQGSARDLLPSANPQNSLVNPEVENDQTYMHSHQMEEYHRSQEEQVLHSTAGLLEPATDNTAVDPVNSQVPIKMEDAVVHSTATLLQSTQDVLQ